MSCQHKYEDINSANLATCIICQQKRQYDPEGKEQPVIVKAGIDFDKVDPHSLTNVHKKAIAQLCKKYDIKVVSRASGLPGRLLSGWVATFLRDKAKYQETMRERRIMAGLVVHLELDPPDNCFLCQQPITATSYSIHTTNTTQPPRLKLHQECAERLAEVFDSLEIRYEMSGRVKV